MLSALAPSSVSPERLLAVDDDNRTLDYGSLSDLKAEWQMVVPGRRLVALLCRNTVPTLAAYIGLQAAGHVIILLSAKTPKPVLNDLVERYAIEAIIEEGQVDLLADPRGGLHEELSICLSTSGSTGSPKLVRFSTAQLASNATAIADYLNLTADEVPLAHLPIEYSFGLSVLHSHMVVGAKVLISEQSVIDKLFWQRLRDATSLSGVPFHFEMLLRMRLGRADLPNMRTLTQAGGRLNRKEAEALYSLATDRNWDFHIMYGQTEAGPRISWLPFDKMRDRLDFIGQPIPGVKLDLDADGELIAQSPSVMLGYAQHRADLSRGDEMNGLLRTGDLAEKIEGLYRITGRKNRFIKLQGNRVSLEDVETRMAQAGESVACAGQDDELTIFCETVDIERVRRKAVELFFFPVSSITVRQVSAFPRTINEKLDYVALHSLLEDP